MNHGRCLEWLLFLLIRFEMADMEWRGSGLLGINVFTVNMEKNQSPKGISFHTLCPFHCEKMPMFLQIAQRTKFSAMLYRGNMKLVALVR